MESGADPQLEAFRRVLANAASGEQAKMDAVVALSLRTVFVACWDEACSAYRTLVNSEGKNALPIFTDEPMLDIASRRFGWGGPDGTTHMREIGAREALRYAIANEVQFAVVDITEEYSIEIDHDEMQPLFSSAARTDTSGPFAGVGIDSSVYKAVKEASDEVESAPPPALAPTDEFLDSIATLLRNYPEVEWAVVFAPEDTAHASIAIRIDPAFPQRSNEIQDAIAKACETSTLGTMLIDTPELVQEIRANSTAFYPWKKKQS